MHFTKALLAAAILSPALGCDGPSVEDTSATFENEKGLTLEDAVLSDLIGANTGLLWSTDLSLDLAILKETGTAFTFLSAELGIWGQNGGGKGGNPVSLTHCMSQVDDDDKDKDKDEDKSTTATIITLTDCFVGANRDRRMNGEVTAERQGNTLEVAIVWNFMVGAIALNGTFDASWENVKTTAIPEATFSLEAVADGNTYNHRTFSVTQGVVVIADRYETPPKYQIPDADSEEFGASISWDNRDDRIDFGLMLKNSGGRYSGDIWGEYTSESGQSLAFSDGQLEESQENHLSLSFSGASQSDTHNFQLTELKQTWGNQTASFTGEVSFSYETQTSLDIGDANASIGLLAYTVTPLTLVGKNYNTTINGAIESALSFQNENDDDKEVWTFGSCDDVSQGRDDRFGASGICTFNNADEAYIGLYFSQETPSTGWILVENGPKEWLCRNLDSGEERELGTSQEAPSNCPE